MVRVLENVSGNECIEALIHRAPPPLGYGEACAACEGRVIT